MSNSAAARVKRRRTGEEDVVDEDAGDKHPNCSSICLVTLSEKLRFLSDKNYDLFGANDSLGYPFYVLSISCVY